jgi:hypothetical protein
VPTAPNLLEGVKLGKGRSWTHLDLQQVVAANALVVHLVVRVVSIAPALVLDKGEPAPLAPAACGCLVLTYSLLDAERGAGMSQRTRRP